MGEGIFAVGHQGGFQHHIKDWNTGTQVYGVTDPLGGVGWNLILLVHDFVDMILGVQVTKKRNNVVASATFGSLGFF